MDTREVGCYKVDHINDHGRSMAINVPSEGKRIRQVLGGDKGSIGSTKLPWHRSVGVVEAIGTIVLL
jgi:hypothetical protein